ncbi:alginate export family protein [Allosphingosinicella sp.]|uniref:alginate export family protein n=1 Tax=Allosphingosinicella sp. TaxID=2823234 RepID=UPI0037851D32
MTVWLLPVLILSTAANGPDPAPSAAPVAGPDRVRLQPIIDARLRYESVSQGPLDAEALTIRVRAGAEALYGPFSMLAESEGTVALADNYNAFAFAGPPSRQRRPQFATVADPENIELNRLQLQYRFREGAVTLGRQRINIDDQRWVGSVGWRQNEQTFDAVRAEARFGPAGVDLAYATSQRTIFGEGAGARTAFGGGFLFANLTARFGPVQGRLFSYLLDYDEAFAQANSSQTYGGVLSGGVPLGRGRMLNLRASYARQSDYARNPFSYNAAYWSVEGSSALAGFTLTAGRERLGSDNGHSVQTPMATLHKFNGWADLFLVTPPAGLDDLYVSVSRRLEGVHALPGLSASLAWHRFDSATGGIAYGSEWDASLGFRLGSVAVLVKYADYDARGFGNDTRKLWLQLEWAH